MNESERTRICGQRYRQRKSNGEPGWADAHSYAAKAKRLDELLMTYRVLPPARVLELGCGNGNVALHAAKRGYRCAGIDIAPEAVAWAKEQAQAQGLTADFQVGDVATLSGFEDEFFDVVFDANCLFMIIGADRAKTVASALRVLRPGGIFYAEAHLLNEAIKQRVVLSGQDYFDPGGQYSTVQGLPMYYYSRKQEFLDLIQNAGFRILRQEIEPARESHKHMPFLAGDIWLEAMKPRNRATSGTGGTDSGTGRSNWMLKAWILPY